MDFIGIGIIILATIGAVHYVHEKAYKRGQEAGVYQGRLQMLNESIYRAEVQKRQLNHEMLFLIERITEEPRRIKYEDRSCLSD